MKPYKGYTAKVAYDADARLFHGEVEGLRDVITFQGTSVTQLEKGFRESVDDYLAFCASRGESPDRPCSGRLILRLDPSLHKQMQQSAAAEGKSLNAWLVETVMTRVAKPRRKAGRRKIVRQTA